MTEQLEELQVAISTDKVRLKNARRTPKLSCSAGFETCKWLVFSTIMDCPTLYLGYRLTCPSKLARGMNSVQTAFLNERHRDTDTDGRAVKGSRKYFFEDRS